MKKLLAIILVLGLVLSFAACGGPRNNDDQAEEKDGNASYDIEEIVGNASDVIENITDKLSSDTVISVPDDTLDKISSIGSVTASIEDQINDMIESQASIFESTNEILKQQGIQLSVEGRDSSLVYSCRYLVDPADKAQAKQQLSDYLNQVTMVELYGTYLQNFKTLCPGITSVICEYRFSDGSLITSKEYK